MNLKDLNILQFLPLFLQSDITSQAIAFALNKQIKKIAQAIDSTSLYINFDKLSEQQLDELAEQFSAVEYSSEFNIDTKRKLIKTCIQTHRERGTVSAVEKIVSIIFNDGYVEEWFNYDEVGQPFNFRVHTSNVSANDSMVKEFETAVKNTQNIRSHLEKVVIETSAALNLNVGMYMQEAEIIEI